MAEAKEPDAATRGLVDGSGGDGGAGGGGGGDVVAKAKGKGGGRASGKEFPAQRWAFVHRGCRKNVKGVLFAERKIKNGFFHRPPILYTRRNTIHRYLYPSYT